MSAEIVGKADTIAYRFYTKLVLVVADARAPSTSSSAAKVDKWFNLETPDTDSFRDSLRSYRTLSTSPGPLPPFVLDVILTVPDLSANEALVLRRPSSSTSSTPPRLRIEPTPPAVLLERWTLAFDTAHGQGESDVAPPTMYKHGIPLFRSLYTLLRVLPAWSAVRRFRRRGGNGTQRHGQLGVRLSVGSLDPNVLTFESAPSPRQPPLPTTTRSFPSIPGHPFGTLQLSVKYLTEPTFVIDEAESLLSSRFLSLDDAGPDFTPTLARPTGQRSGLSNTGGSGGGGSGYGFPSPSRPAAGSVPSGGLAHVHGPNRSRGSLPATPPSAAAIADRFILPASPGRGTVPLPGVGAGSAGPGAGGMHTRTTSLSGSSSRHVTSPVPLSRPSLSSGPTPGPSNTGPAIGGGSGASPGGASIGSTSSHGHGGPSLASRTRRESHGALASTPSPTGASMPVTGPGGTSTTTTTPTTATGSPVPIRRPALNPFKSGPLGSGSPSLSSPLRTTPTTPLPMVIPSSGSSLSPRMNPVSLPGPSSLGERRSLGGASDGSGSPSNASATAGSPATGSIPLPGGAPGQRKRYSSTFANRPSVSALGGAAASEPVLPTTTTLGLDPVLGVAGRSEVVGTSSPLAERGAGALPMGLRERSTSRTRSTLPSSLGGRRGASEEDESLSAFVESIDSRAPLRAHAPTGGGHHRRGSSLSSVHAPGHDREETITQLPSLQHRATVPTATTPGHGTRTSRISEVSEPSTTSSPTTTTASGSIHIYQPSSSSSSASASASGSSSSFPPIPSTRARTSSPLASTRSPLQLNPTSEGSRGREMPMLTRAAEVDVRLREMNDAFRASLAGLGSGGPSATTANTASASVASPSDAVTAAHSRSGSGPTHSRSGSGTSPRVSSGLVMPLLPEGGGSALPRHIMRELDSPGGSAGGSAGGSGSSSLVGGGGGSAVSSQSLSAAGSTNASASGGGSSAEVVGRMELSPSERERARKA